MFYPAPVLRVARSRNSARASAILIAVSCLFVQPARVNAQTGGQSDPTGDVSIKTLPPLSGSSQPRTASGAQSNDNLTMPDPAAAPAPSQPFSLSSGNGHTNLSYSPSPSSPSQPTLADASDPVLTPASAKLGAVPESKDNTTDGDAQTSSSDDKKASGKEAEQVAQMPANAQRQHNPIPAIAGTVTLRKPFKLFIASPEPLIHNLSFRDTPVREVVAEIARRGNLNVIFDRSVNGKITGELRDVTLNEAMDSILTSAGLQHRSVDANTVVIGSQAAMVQLGLNRSIARAFKLSYAHPYEVANILTASVFNRGVLPDFNKQVQDLTQSQTKGDSASRRMEGAQTDINEEGPNVDSVESRNTSTLRLDQPRFVRGTSREQTQEGVGFNNAATDPGSQQVRAFQTVNTDYSVEQNGGNAIVVPDAKRHQVIVVGTVEDLQVAEDAIRFIDRRPREVHIQASLIEITNQGIRELGATLNVQGAGASSSIMGSPAAPLNGFLQGLGSPPVQPFTSTTQLTSVSQSPNGPFSGLLGMVLPAAPQIAQVQAANTAQSGFNFLSLSRAAGGISNIATYPYGLNLSVNLLLQTNKAKVIANPSVVVADDTEALITIASEVIHKVTSTVSLGVVTTNVELTKAGIFLDVLPRIGEDGFVTMRLRPSVSEPTGAPQTFGSTASPTIVTLLSVREIMSQEVRVKDGQTLVIGGLFTEQEAAQLSKVPYLAEAPVLGALFRNSLKGRNRTELMLLLTPKIVEEDPVSVSDSNPAPLM